MECNKRMFNLRVANSPMFLYKLCNSEVVFSADEAVRRCKDGEKVILVRIETSPDDIHGLHAAEGVLTTRGNQIVTFWMFFGGNENICEDV